MMPPNILSFVVIRSELSGSQALRTCSRPYRCKNATRSSGIMLPGFIIIAFDLITKFLKMSDSGIAMEAAYNLSIIYVMNGSPGLAKALYRRWLSLWNRLFV